MSVLIPNELQDLLEQQIVVSLSTVRKNGAPHLTPMWFEYDGTHIILNTAKGRVADLNIRRDPRVAIAFIDPENAYRYVSIRGTVVEVIEGEEAETQIDNLSGKYIGVSPFPNRGPGEKRVMFRVVPEHAKGLLVER